MPSLAGLMTSDRGGDCAVAVRGATTLSWSEFVAHVGALRAVLRTATGSVPDTAGTTWGVHTDDAYAFAVAVMAIWQIRGVAVVLPNLHPGTIAEASSEIHGLVTDCGNVFSVVAVPALQPSRVGRWRAIDLDRAAPAVALFTSGTTGSHKTIIKTVANLDDEIAGLERSWGAVLGDRQALGTVSQQHIYGLLFRVLWPLTMARPFHTAAALYPEEMLARLGGRRGYLVSTPAHLRRLVDMRGANALGRECSPIFSSGAPLGEATALRFIDTVGFAPVEVFGSTETGGVGWRQRTGDPLTRAWMPFDDVRIASSADGHLSVSSPRVSPPGSFTMADAAAIGADSRFLLHGRTDRDVKVGGKRLSLPEMEDRLLRHAYVTEAAVTTIGGRGEEARVGAAVVLTEKGLAYLSERGRRAVSAELIAHLGRYWDRVLLPRAFRYVARLPEDAQGKVASAALASLFEPSREAVAWSAEVVEEWTDGNACSRRLRVPGPSAFAGHFPELPVVPGFVQLEWVMDAATHLVGRPVALASVEALKFKELLHPDETIELSAVLTNDGACLGFRLARDDGRVVSQGRCWLTEDRA